jgi:histidyl-tRNA synthetase
MSDRFKALNIKGNADISPGQQAVRNRVINILRSNFEQYGYLPIETSQLNYLDLLTYKYAPDAEIVREIYKINDQGGRALGLRFDLTVPFCKYISLNKNLKMPFKRYEIGKVFRNGPVKSGRAREFYQCDIDAVGISGVHIEAELIAVMVKCFLRLGIEPVIKYNNRKLLPQDDAVISVIDKFEKVTRQEVLEGLAKHMSLSDAEELLQSFNGKQKCEEIELLEKELKNLGIEKYCSFTPSLARGLNIYTGNVWEVFDKLGRISSSLGGGGRYDNIIGSFIGGDTSYPAAGASFGLEPIIAVLSSLTDSAPLDAIGLMIVPLGTESFSQKFADSLRCKGHNILVYLGGKSIAKALEYADKNNIRYVSVIGEDEIKSGEVFAKDLKTGVQVKIKESFK